MNLARHRSTDPCSRLGWSDNRIPSLQNTKTTQNTLSHDEIDGTARTSEVEFCIFHRHQRITHFAFRHLQLLVESSVPLCTRHTWGNAVSAQDHLNKRRKCRIKNRHLLHLTNASFARSVPRIPQKRKSFHQWKPYDSDSLLFFARTLTQFFAVTRVRAN